MSQAELRELFLASGVAEPSTAFRLVPVDPCRALERGNARMAALDERGPDDGAVVEGPGLAMSVDEAAVVEGQQQHDEKGEAEKEELDDDDDDDEDEDDDDDDDEDEEEDEAKTAKEAEAATEAMAMDKTTTGMATAHGDVGA